MTFPWQYGQWIAIGRLSAFPSRRNFTACSGGVSIGSVPIGAADAGPGHQTSLATYLAGGRLGTVMRSLPLEDVHRGLGAAFGDVAGWRLPLDYGDAAAEQRAVRATAGVIDWSAEGKTRIDGADRTSFLDGVLTNDVGALAQGRGAHAAALDHKGRVRGDVVVYHGGDHYFLATEPEATAPVLAHLNQLLVSDDATLTDVSARWCAFGLFGPRSPEIAANLLVGSPPEEAYRVVAAEREGTPFVLARSPYVGGDGFELWAPPEGAEAVWRSLLDAGAIPFGLRALEALRIEAGRPRYPADMNETTLAIEARLEPSISFTKGCYVGQEVVSRATRIGHVNRLLVGLAVDGPGTPAPGTAVAADGKTVGAITSAARSESMGTAIALGYVRRESSEPGTELLVAGDPERRARVAALPFVRA